MYSKRDGVMKVHELRGLQMMRESRMGHMQFPGFGFGDVC